MRNLVFYILFFSASLAQAQKAAVYKFSPGDFAILQKNIRVSKNSFTVDELNQALKDLVLKRELEIARILINGNTAILQLKEVSGDKKFEIAGNQAITTDEIITILGVNKADRVNKFEIQRNIPRLKERYDAVGLKKVDITFKENGEGSNLSYLLEINEGSTTRLEDIVVLSSNAYLNEHIRYKLRDMLNQKIDREVLKKIEVSVNEILLQNRILDAKIAKISPIYNQDRTSARLTITLETTSTYEFLFYGNTAFSAGNIIAHLEIDKNYLNYIKNRKLFIKNIEALYRENGYPHATIESETIYFEKMSKYVLKFTIKEGAQVRIKSVNVSGKISRSPSYYESRIFENLGDLKNGNLFVDENIRKSVDKLILDLKDEGFLRAERINLEFKINKNATADIFVQINENILTQIRTINFAGLMNFTANQLYDVIDLRPNTPLNLVKVLKSYSQLKTFYQRNGYLEFDIKTTPDKLIKYVDNYEFADITYELKEGPQIKIKDIQTRGNSFTKDKVILRELDLMAGDVLTSDTVNDSVIFLERTQLFARAQINTSDANTNVAERTVFVDVQEKNPGLLSSGVGLSNERDVTFRGYLGVAYRNLGGTGRGLSGRADLKYSLKSNIQFLENRLVLGYYEPFLFYNRLRSRVSIIREQQVFDETVDDRVRIQENNEVNFLLEKQVTRRLKLTWYMWNLSRLTTFYKDDSSVQRKVEIGSIGPALEWDRRDDTFLPRDGTYTTGQVEYANPLLGSTSNATNEINFVRATASHTIYTPLTNSKNWVLVNDFRGGYLDNLSDKPQSGVPAARLFFLGGRSTLRGYDLRNNERVPSLKEICPTCSTIDDYKVRTASHFYLLKSEVRFPLYGNIGGLVFYDGGAVLIKNQPMEDAYRDTAGFGARYNTPIGAFTVELGFKLDKKRESPIYMDESPFMFHISMGSY